MFNHAGFQPGLRGIAALWLLALCTPAVAQPTSIGLNFTGVTVADGITLNSNDGYAPPDNAGAVGPHDVVQLINGAYAVYDKTSGSQTQLISAKDFWESAGMTLGNEIANLGTFNARIIYDPTVDRWFAAGLSAQSTNNNVMIARSDSSDPKGTWQAVSFLGNNGGAGLFADFTSLGIDADGVYVATNNFTSNTPGAQFTYDSLYSVPKADLLLPTPSVANLTRFDGLNAATVGHTLQPIIDFGPSKGHAPILAAANPLSTTQILRTDLSGTTGAGATLSSTTVITVPTYTIPPAAEQPDGIHTISTIDHRLNSQVYQVDDTIYSIQNTLLGSNSALVWMKINETDNSLIQRLVISDPNFDYFNASVAANAYGDVVIGFTRSGHNAAGNLSAYAMVGHTFGSLTIFDSPLLLKEGLVGDYDYFSGRWGDWTTTVADPTKPRTFWTFQEYALDTDAWATQITEITVPEPQSIALGLFALASLLLVARRRLRSSSARCR